MSAALNPTVVDAFVASLRDVFEATTGIAGVIQPLQFVSTIPPPPHLMVTIQLKGGVMGPAIWLFDPQVARELAGRMLASDVPLAYDSPECRDALGEFANILVGNVSGALLDAGYPIELSTPTTAVTLSPEQALSQRSLKVSLRTPAGDVDLVLALTLN